MAFLCFFPIPHTASRRQIDATPCQCVPPSLFSCNAMQTVRKRLQDIQFIVKAVIHHHWPIFWLQNFWWKCGNDVPWNRSNPSKSHRSNLSSPPIYPSVCLLVSPCVYLICLSFLSHTPYLCRIYVPIFVPVYAICLSVYLSIYLPLPSFTYLSAHLPIGHVEAKPVAHPRCRPIAGRWGALMTAVKPAAVMGSPGKMVMHGDAMIYPLVN